MRVLIIVDDPRLNNNIKEALTAESWNAESVFDGLLAERLLKKETFDCIIMDINLPDKTPFIPEIYTPFVALLKGFVRSKR